MLWRLFWLGLLFALCHYFFQLLLLFDYGKRIFSHRPGPCRQLKGIVDGAEDIALIETEGLAFISSGTANMIDRPGITGEIFLFDFENPSEDPLKLPIEGMINRTTFRPHGMSHWVSNGRIRLYVINHTPPEWSHSVEVFDYDKEKKILRHVRTIRDEKFIRPNDLVAVDEDRLIIGNDATAQTALGTFLELIFFQKTGSLVFHNGEESFWIAEGMMSPNGIALDRSRRRLLVSHINEKSLGVYELSDDFHSISPLNKIFIGSYIDNLWVDVDETVWIGAHPVVNILAAYLSDMNNPKAYAPSQILRLKFDINSGAKEIQEVFADDGRFLCASSGAVHMNGKVLMGSIFRQAVVCDIFEELP